MSEPLYRIEANQKIWAGQQAGTQAHLAERQLAAEVRTASFTDGRSSQEGRKFPLKSPLTLKSYIVIGCSAGRSFITLIFLT